MRSSDSDSDKILSLSESPDILEDADRHDRSRSIRSKVTNNTYGAIFFCTNWERHPGRKALKINYPHYLRLLSYHCHRLNNSSDDRSSKSTGRVGHAIRKLGATSRKYDFTE